MVACFLTASLDDSQPALHMFVCCTSTGCSESSFYFSQIVRGTENPGQEDGIWGQFLGASTVTYSKPMLEDKAIYLGNVCCAKINSGYILAAAECTKS